MGSTLQDTDFILGNLGGNQLRFLNRFNRLDVTNLTVGLHGELDRSTTVMVGGVFPLADAPDRAFDAEVLVAINRRF